MLFLVFHQICVFLRHRIIDQHRHHHHQRMSCESWQARIGWTKIIFVESIRMQICYLPQENDYSANRHSPRNHTSSVFILLKQKNRKNDSQVLYSSTEPMEFLIRTMNNATSANEQTLKGFGFGENHSQTVPFIRHILYHSDCHQEFQRLKTTSRWLRPSSLFREGVAEEKYKR